MKKGQKEQKEQPILKPKIDLIFKLIFGTEPNLDILTDFLKCVLNIKDDEFIGIEIIDPHTRTEKINDKMSILDIKLNTTRGIINVEIQLNKYTDMEDRIIFGISKSITNQKHSGNNYKLKKVVTILITDYVLIAEHEQYHDIFNYNSKKTGHTFSSITEIHTLELPKLPDDYDNSNLWYWLKFIKSEKEEDFEMLSEQKPLIKKAYGVLKELSQDEKTRLLAEAREAYQWDIIASNRNAKAEGLREGIEKGEEQKAINIAKNMLKRGTPIEYILEDTGLDINTIKKLQNEK